MRKLLIAATGFVCALPAAAADAPALLKPPVPTAALQSWTADFTILSVSMPKDSVVRSLNLALTISADGNVTGCTVEQTSGSASLDDQICALFRQKGQFQPATDAAGKPIVGVFRVLAALGTPDQNIPPFPTIDMVVEVQKMPAGLADPAYVDVAVSVGETGNVDRCAVTQATDWAGAPVAARIEAGRILGETACAQAVKTLKLESAKNPQGQSVRSVQTALVMFTAQAAALAARAKQPVAPPKANGEIVITGKREAKIPYRGSDPIEDFQPAGREVVLLKAKSGAWYRATLVSPCIGSSSLIKMVPGGSTIEIEPNLIEIMPREIRRALEEQFGLVKTIPEGVTLQEGLAFPTHADGTFDRNSVIIATVIDPFDVVQVRRCRMSSLVESDPPAKKGRKAR